MAISDEMIKERLKSTLGSTDLPGLGKKYAGKVRDCYTKGDKCFLVSTDRLSAFDVVLTTIPFKGQILTQMSAFWFNSTRDILPNHVIDAPDPNVIVAKKCGIYPIEMVVRGYLTGSAWRDYEKGRPVSGVTLPKGMKKNQKLAEPIVTPSTKEATGHDQQISREEIIKKGIVGKEEYGQIEEYALAIFGRGRQICEKKGLILVDTKYEFGNLNGDIIIADELHTPDSSRYWVLSSYGEGSSPEMLDKEHFRGWLMERGYMGDGKPPEIPDPVRVEFAKRYLRVCGMLVDGFKPAKEAPTQGRIMENLKRAGYLPEAL